MVAEDAAARAVEHEDGLPHHEGGFVLVDRTLPRGVVVGLSRALRVASVPAHAKKKVKDFWQCEPANSKASAPVIEAIHPRLAGHDFVDEAETPPRRAQHAVGGHGAERVHVIDAAGVRVSETGTGERLQQL